VITPGQRHDSTQLAPSWTGFVSRDRVGGDDPALGRIASSLTRATATRAVVGCTARGTSRTPFPSAPISRRAAPLGLVARWSSTGRSMRGATSWSSASTDPNSGAGWPRATRSAPSTIGRWSSSPPSPSGLTRDSSLRP
jgi:hypothetical protein